MRSQFLFFVTILCYSLEGFTQSSQNDSLPNATLPACIQYALTHQPHIQQSLLDEKIANATIRTKLGDWFPQISLDAYYQHNIKLPTNFFNGAFIANGTSNISSIGISGTQNIFNPDVFVQFKIGKVNFYKLLQIFRQCFNFNCFHLCDEFTTSFNTGRYTNIL